MRLESVNPGGIASSTREEEHVVKKILAVQEVPTSLLKSNPPQLIVSESGLVSSPEWTDARLVRSVVQPSQGELHPSRGSDSRACHFYVIA